MQKYRIKNLYDNKLDSLSDKHLGAMSELQKVALSVSENPTLKALQDITSSSAFAGLRDIKETISSLKVGKDCSALW